MNNQTKKAQTKQKIRAAFWDAYETMPLDKITVSQLAANAGISRITFYAYYADVPAILAEMEQEILDAIEERSRVHRVSICDGAAAAANLLEIVALMENYEQYISLILGDHGDPSFEGRLRTLMKTLFMTNHAPLTPEKEYVLEYVFLVQFGLVSYWLRQGKTISTSDLVALCRHLVVYGAYDYLDSTT